MLRNRSAVLKNHASMLRYGAAVLRIRSNLSFFEFFDLNWHFFGLFYLPVVSGRSGAPINRPTDQRSGVMAKDGDAGAAGEHVDGLRAG